jgi:hypothetical protein
MTTERRSTMKGRKNYRVMVKAYSTVLVIGAESEGEALDLALCEINYSDFEIEQSEIDGIVKDKDLERERKRANAVSFN